MVLEGKEGRERGGGMVIIPTGIELTLLPVGNWAMALRHMASADMMDLGCSLRP